MVKRLTYQGKQRPASVEVRSTRITVLMPMISGMRHSKNPAAILCATVLQAAVRDLERLNDVEMCCFQYGSQTPGSQTPGSQTQEFFTRMSEILSRV